VGVNDKRADFHSKRFLVGCTVSGLGEPLHRSPFAESDDVGFGRGDGARWGDEDGERQRYAEMALEEAEHGRG
jgi:hypothetical protein